MFPDTSQIRKAARAVYKNNALGSLTVSFGMLVTAFLGSLLSYLISFFAKDFWIYIFLLFYIYFLVIPVFLGAIRYFSMLVEGKSAQPVEMFYYFSSLKAYKRAIAFVSGIFFVVFISLVIAMIIPYALLLFTSEGVYNFLGVSMPIWTPILKIVSVFLEILGIGLVVLVNIKYYLSVYLFVCNDKISVSDALKLSVRISRKTKSDFWMLIFSMTGYILISLTVMPLFFLMPYFSLAYIAHGKCAAVKYNESFDFSNKQYTVVAK